jgi:hypothetical protein
MQKGAFCKLVPWLQIRAQNSARDPKRLHPETGKVGWFGTILFKSDNHVAGVANLGS